MRVLKRGARGYEDVKFDKITDRIRNLCTGLHVDPVKIALQTIRNIYDGITTEELDIISAKIAEGFKLLHPDYSILAAKILVSNLHKTTPRRFSDCMEIVAQNTELISQPHLGFICANANALDNMIIDSNDYLFDYLGFKTYEHGYLIKIPTDVLGADGKPIYVDHDGEVRTNVSAGKYPYAIVNDRKLPLIKKTTDRVVDRPQYMFMRVAVALNMHRENALEHIKITYKVMSQLYYTHATPTLFNACMHVQQLNSCFLQGTDDSIEGIQHTKTNAALISKRAGGIGIHMSNIRSKGSRIGGTNGKSSGLPKQLKIYNEEACCWDQGGKRRGAFAIYLEPWHGDVFEFLRLKLNQGAETERARDLFYALWIPDLFIKRAEADLDWSLFSEHTAPGLSSVYDGMEICKHCGHCENADFKKHANILEPLIRSKLNTTSVQPCDHVYMECDVFTWLYTLYEDEGRAVKVIKARDLFDPICDSQRESGTPYVMLKDNVNRQTNQKNIGTIKSSNLCAEIMEWSSADSYACCTLASINLKKFLTLVDNNDNDNKYKRYKFDFEKLHEIVRLITRNLDTVIDVNDYPVPECIENSHGYRPIGIGIQGLADVFAIMRIPYSSAEAHKLDLAIAETIYHAALTESNALAVSRGKHVGFDGSPAARGILQFDMFLANQLRLGLDTKLAHMYEWEPLRDSIEENGLRNSLLIALMPTVSTSQGMGNNESFEPFPANIYTKTTLAGKFTLTNNHMIRHLIELGLWTDAIKNKIIAADGSVQGIEEIPRNVRDIYKTVWEEKQSDLMKRAALRGAYVDQSQSLNIHLNDNSNGVLRGVIMTGAKLGLKTVSYYIRTRPASKAVKTNITESAHQESDISRTFRVAQELMAVKASIASESRDETLSPTHSPTHNDTLNAKKETTMVDVSAH